MLNKLESDTCNSVLFRALYEEGKNISLVKTCLELGLFKIDLRIKEDLQKYLENNEGLKDVYKEVEYGKNMYAIKTVPYFVIQKNGHQDVDVSGARSVETFVKVLRDFERLD